MNVRLITVTLLFGTTAATACLAGGLPPIASGVGNQVSTPTVPFKLPKPKFVVCSLPDAALLGVREDGKTAYVMKEGGEGLKAQLSLWNLATGVCHSISIPNLIGVETLSPSSRWLSAEVVDHYGRNGRYYGHRILWSPSGVRKLPALSGLGVQMGNIMYVTSITDDGNTIVIEDGEGSESEKGCGIYRWNAAKQNYVLVPGSAGIPFVALSPNGKFAVAQSAIYDISSNPRLVHLTGLTDAVDGSGNGPSDDPFRVSNDGESCLYKHALYVNHSSTDLTFFIARFNPSGTHGVLRMRQSVAAVEADAGLNLIGSSMFVALRNGDRYQRARLYDLLSPEGPGARGDFTLSWMAPSGRIWGGETTLHVGSKRAWVAIFPADGWPVKP